MRDSKTTTEDGFVIFHLAKDKIWVSNIDQN